MTNPSITKKLTGCRSLDNTISQQYIVMLHYNKIASIKRRLGCAHNLPIRHQAVTSIGGKHISYNFAAGDHVKFNFPGAFTATLLTWGLLESWDGYRRAGELDNMLDSVKWQLDYFMKCHTAPDELYGQVMYIMVKSHFVRVVHFRLITSWIIGQHQ